MPYRDPQEGSAPWSLLTRDDILQAIIEAGGRVDPPEVLAKNTLAMIEGRVPGRVWEQETWVGKWGCDTSCCVAGDVLIQAGLIDDDLRVVDIGFGDLPTSSKFRRVAKALLDLDDREAFWLFSSVRTRARVVEALKAIRDGKRVSDLKGVFDDAS